MSFAINSRTGTNENQVIEHAVYNILLNVLL